MSAVFTHYKTLPPPPLPSQWGPRTACKKPHNSTTLSCIFCVSPHRQRFAPLSDDRTKISVLFGSLGRFVLAACYADLRFVLLLGTFVLAACYADLKPGVHQHSDLWLLLAASVITACYLDLKPGVHQNSDVWLPLAAFVIAVCYAEQKPGVRHAKSS